MSYRDDEFKEVTDTDVVHYISLGSILAAATLGAAVWFFPATLLLRASLVWDSLGKSLFFNGIFCLDDMGEDISTTICIAVGI